MPAPQSPIAAASTTRGDARDEAAAILEQIPGVKAGWVAGTRRAAVAATHPLQSATHGDWALAMCRVPTKAAPEPEEAVRAIAAGTDWPTLNGHHALFAVQGDTVWLGRDIAGQVPVHARSGADAAGACTDQRALLDWGGPADWDDKVVAKVLRGDWRDASQSTRVGFHRIPPGMVESYRDARRLSRKRHWEGNKIRCKYWTPFEEARDAFRDAFYQAVERTLPDEGPIGLMFSGGLDSSGIAAVARDIVGPDREIHAFTVVPGDEESDEGDYPAIVAEELDLVHHIIPDEDLRFDDCYKAVASRMAEAPLVANLLLHEACLRHAKKQGIRVLLDGVPGDYVAGFGQAATLDAILHADLPTLRDHFRGNPLRAGKRRVVSPILAWKRGAARRVGAHGPTEGQQRRSSAKLNWIGRVSEESQILGIAMQGSFARPFLDLDLLRATLFTNTPRHQYREGLHRFLYRQALRGVLSDAVAKRTTKGDYSGMTLRQSERSNLLGNAMHDAGSTPETWWAASQTAYKGIWT